MTKATLDALSKAIHSSPGICYRKKAEMMNLLRQLQDELDSETIRTSSRAVPLRSSITEISSEHPDLSELTARACKMLSDIGI